MNNNLKMSEVIMAGKLIYKALTVLVILVALTLYILGILMSEYSKLFSLANSLILLITGLGIVALIKAITSKVNMYLIFSAILITGALIFTGVNYNILPEHNEWLYFPIGAGLLLLFLLFRYLFNIRKWDAGDNEKLGYKNFRVRQAEKEHEEIEEEISGIEKEIRQKEKEKALLMMDIEDKRKQKENIKIKK